MSFSKRVLVLAGMMLVLCAVAPAGAAEREGKNQLVTHDPAWCEELYFVGPSEPWPCPAADADGDGVGNERDKCPNTPSGARVDSSGCPLDSDGDGVDDGSDRCPNTPRGTKVDERGCPSDSDGDGVADGTDQCPNTPRGDRVDARGCSLDGDNDGDGVKDSADRCPGTPRGTNVGPDGCPPRVTPPAPAAPPPAAVVAPGQRLVLEGVTFASNRATLTGNSTSVLDRVADGLKANPDVRIEIGGHTDRTGDDAHNMKLSEARAAAVRDYLVSQGVDRSRIEVRGYGETMPVADNETAEGRAKNRRVELKRAN